MQSHIAGRMPAPGAKSLEGHEKRNNDTEYVQEFGVSTADNTEPSDNANTVEMPNLIKFTKDGNSE
jgi:hypothetical protein